MATSNPRDIVRHTDNDAHYETYEIDASTITYDATEEGGSAQVGLAVTFSADDTVALTADASAVLGKLIRVEPDGKCNVQDGGYTTLPAGSGATTTRGKKIVGALGAGNARGYIRDVATDEAAELGVARGLIVNVATATAIVVKLDA
jgi:hypothetical protein